MAFNEDSRVKLPALVHLTRLGYVYVPLKTALAHVETLMDADPGSPQEEELEFD